MNDHYLTREQARKVDAVAIDQFGIPGIVLMENAARGCVDRLVAAGLSGRVVVVCGGGNNGGDGLAMARHLDLRGYDVRVLQATDPSRLRGDAETNYAILTKTNVPLDVVPATATPVWFDEQVSGAEWIVDALLGTGSQGTPRSPISDLIAAINRSSAKRLAVDLPSGLDCDTGEPSQPTIRADVTCTFVAAKRGFTNPAAASYLGRVHVLDIGAPRQVLERVLGNP